MVHAAAAPEGVNVEQVADMIAAAPLDDQREWLTMERDPHSSSCGQHTQEPADSRRDAPLPGHLHAPLPAFNPLPSPHPSIHTYLPRLVPPMRFPHV